MILADGQYESDLELVRILAIVIHFDKLLGADVLLEDFAKTINGGAHGLIVYTMKAQSEGFTAL